MAITRGIICGYCGDNSSQSDYQMEIHLRNYHKEEINTAKEKNNAERERIYNRKE